MDLEPAEAVSAQWALPRPPDVRGRFWDDLRVLVIRGYAAGSISIVGARHGALDVVLVRFGLADGGVGARRRPRGGGARAGDGFLVFYWILTRLPRAAVPRGVVSAALVGAVGFEVLKQATALTIGSVTGTPGGAVFGPLLGLLLFCYLVSRFALLVSAWAATARGNELPTPPAEPAVTDAPTPGGEPTPRGTPSGEPAPLPTPSRHRPRVPGAHPARQGRRAVRWVSRWASACSSGMAGPSPPIPRRQPRRLGR